MKKKILDRHEQSRAVLASATALGSSLQPLAEQIQLDRQQEEAKRQRMEIDSVNAQRAADEQTASSASTSLQEETLRQHEEQVKVQHQLRLKAETSRCRRKYLTGILRQLTTALNDHRPRGEAAIVAAVKRLQVSCSHPTTSNNTDPQTSSSPSPYHTVLQTVVTLLGKPLHVSSCQPTVSSHLPPCPDNTESISAKPDNVLLRRLRHFHPDLWSKVVCWDGGLALLLAVGFSVKVTDAAAFAQEYDRLVRSNTSGR